MIDSTAPIRHNTAQNYGASAARNKKGAIVSSFEGRTRDLLELANGRILTPRQVDAALIGIQGLAQYRCVQEARDRIRAEYVRDGGADPSCEIHTRLGALLDGTTVILAAERFIPPEPSGKYRTTVPL